MVKASSIDSSWAWSSSAWWHSSLTCYPGHPGCPTTPSDLEVITVTWWYNCNYVWNIGSDTGHFFQSSRHPQQLHRERLQRWWAGSLPAATTVILSPVPASKAGCFEWTGCSLSQCPVTRPRITKEWLALLLASWWQARKGRTMVGGEPHGILSPVTYVIPLATQLILPSTPHSLPASILAHP